MSESFRPLSREQSINLKVMRHKLHFRSTVSQLRLLLHWIVAVVVVDAVAVVAVAVAVAVDAVVFVDAAAVAVVVVVVVVVVSLLN